MRNVEDYLLTKNVTVRDLNNWMVQNDETSKNSIIDLILHRFENRYIKHVVSVNSGFLKMAISCLMIEAFESFKQGIDDTTGKSQSMFRDFFRSEVLDFPDFKDIAKDFYSNVRCGILHQAETTNAWRILLCGPLLDLNEKSINAELFVFALQKSLERYIDNLRAHGMETTIWLNAFSKLKSICKNCELQIS